MGEHHDISVTGMNIIDSFYLSRTRQNLLVETSLFQQVI